MLRQRKKWMYIRMTAIYITIRDSLATKLKLARQRKKRENGLGEEHKGQTERKEDGEVYDDWS